MLTQSNQLDFTNQDFYVGIDVHKNRWSVTIRKGRMEMESIMMNSDPGELHRHMCRGYPGGRYHSVYEAGFCGFWIHRELISLGFNNIVVNPADIPTCHKERDQKTDRIDSRKLARELENQSLKAIYIPNNYNQQLRSLVRLRHIQVKQMTRLKNTIKSFLLFNGIHLPPQSQIAHWSNPFLDYLSQLNFDYPASADYMRFNLEALRRQRTLLLDILQQLREYSRREQHRDLIHRYLCSIPGIGFVSAMILYSEIIDIHRFPSMDNLKSFFGLVPSISSSGEHTTQRGLTNRRNPHLRYIIIEAAWVAVRKDPAITMAFDKLCERMPRQQAIIRIAKKLINRIRYVWIHQKPYQKGVIQ